MEKKLDRSTWRRFGDVVIPGRSRPPPPTAVAEPPRERPFIMERPSAPVMNNHPSQTSVGMGYDGQRPGRVSVAIQTVPPQASRPQLSVYVPSSTSTSSSGSSRHNVHQRPQPQFVLGGAPKPAGRSLSRGMSKSMNFPTAISWRRDGEAESRPMFLLDPPTVPVHPSASSLHDNWRQRDRRAHSDEPRNANVPDSHDSHQHWPALADAGEAPPAKSRRAQCGGSRSGYPLSVSSRSMTPLSSKASTLSSRSSYSTDDHPSMFTGSTSSLRRLKASELAPIAENTTFSAMPRSTPMLQPPSPPPTPPLPPPPASRPGIFTTARSTADDVERSPAPVSPPSDVDADEEIVIDISGLTQYIQDASLSGSASPVSLPFSEVRSPQPPRLAPQPATPAGSSMDVRLSVIDEASCASSDYAASLLGITPSASERSYGSSDAAVSPRRRRRGRRQAGGQRHPMVKPRTMLSLMQGQQSQQQESTDSLSTNAAATEGDTASRRQAGGQRHPVIVGRTASQLSLEQSIAQDDTASRPQNPRLWKPGGGRHPAPHPTPREVAQRRSTPSLKAAAAGFSNQNNSSNSVNSGGNNSSHTASGSTGERPVRDSYSTVLKARPSLPSFTRGFLLLRSPREAPPATDGTTPSSSTSVGDSDKLKSAGVSFSSSSSSSPVPSPPSNCYSSEQASDQRSSSDATSARSSHFHWPNGGIGSHPAPQPFFQTSDKYGMMPPPVVIIRDGDDDLEDYEERGEPIMEVRRR